MQQAFQISVVTVSLLVEFLIAKIVVGIPISPFLSASKVGHFSNQISKQLDDPTELRL